MLIRKERSGDQPFIRSLVVTAFAGKAFSDGTEADVIDRLRRRQALSLSLVAEEGGSVMGYVCFSPAAISSGRGSWFALGPIAVSPERQGQGIGGMLIREGLEALRLKMAWGCILVGDPAFYSQHGFVLAPEHCPVGEPKKNFQLNMISSDKPEGVFSFHEAFYSV